MKGPAYADGRFALPPGFHDTLGLFKPYYLETPTQTAWRNGAVSAGANRMRNNARDLGTGGGRLLGSLWREKPPG